MANITIKLTNESKINGVDFNNLPFGKVFSDHMFVSDYYDGEWQDHRIEPLRTFNVHPANMTFHYGQAIFEGLKASKDADGTPLLFRPEQNAARLNKSAVRMCMPVFPEDVFLEALKMLVSIDKEWIPISEGAALYIRPFMIAMDESLGVAASSKYRMVIMTGPSGPYYAKPVKLFADSYYVRAVMGGTGEAKCAGNYAGSLFPTKLARDKGYDQILWLDAIYHKYVQEVGTMNIMFVLKDKKVITPITDGAILKGITRDSILTILRDRGYQVEERLISIDEILDEYEKGNLIETFGAGTAAVVTNVAEITYKDKTIHFSEENWDLSKTIKQYINELRSGRIEDKFGFVMPVDNLIHA